MNDSFDESRHPRLDVHGMLARSKRMLRDLEQANLDRSQLSAKPLALTLLAVGASLTLAGLLYRTNYLGTSAGIRVSYSTMALASGVVIMLLAALLVKSGRRLTAGVKTLVTLTCAVLYLMALTLNGIMPAIFLPVVVITFHLMWHARVSLVVTLLVTAVSAPFMLRDQAASQAVSARLLICTIIFILMMQILSRQIIRSYRKSLQVSEQLSGMVGSLGEQLDDSQDRLEMALRTDADSGLMNTAGFEDVADGQLVGASAESRYAVLCIKLKGMEISKSLLAEGERKALLKIISQRLWRVAGSDGAVARSGRSDFLVLMKLEEGDGRNDDVQLAEILDNLGQPLQLRHHTIPCHPFIGVSIWPIDGRDSADLRRKAETAARMAMGDGINHVVRFDSSMQQAIRERMLMTSGIKAAIDMNQFELEYQPVFNLGHEHFNKVEALIRWNHPELGRVPPNRFIPLLDPEQLIEVTAWVLNTINAQMKHWHAQTGMRLDVAVNIPAPYLKDRIGREQYFFERLKSFNPESGSLIFEITENSLFEAGEEGLRFLGKLRAEGIRIALDDFGTGFSNLRQLEVLPLDILKIDKSLIDEIGESERKMALCGYIIRLGHELGLKVVAEGIETEGQRDALIWAGCDYGQGYLFAKPLPAARIPDFFSDSCPATA